MGQAIKIGGIDTNKMVGRWTAISRASAGQESVSITNPFSSTSISVDPYCETVSTPNSTDSIAITGITVTTSTITLKFDKLEKDTNFKCKVYRT